MSVGCDASSVCLSQFTKDVWDAGSVPGSVLGKGDLTTPGGIITAVWPYLFAIAGLVLFGMLVWGAMEIMFGAATPKSAESGKTRITQAVIGFVILFMAFWIGQIVQQIFGLNFGVGQEVGVTAPEQIPSDNSDTQIVNYKLSSSYTGGNLQFCADLSGQTSPDGTAVVKYIPTDQTAGQQTKTVNLQVEKGQNNCFGLIDQASLQEFALSAIAANIPEAQPLGTSSFFIKYSPGESGSTNNVFIYLSFPSSYPADLKQKIQAYLESQKSTAALDIYVQAKVGASNHDSNTYFYIQNGGES